MLKEKMIKKLDEVSLENVSGGFLSRKAVIYLLTCTALTVVGTVGATGTAIAGAVYGSKAVDAMDAGDMQKAKKYGRVSEGCTIAAAVCGGAAALGTAGIVVPVAMDS